MSEAERQFPRPPQELSIIETERQVKALNNPERVRILEMLVQEPATAKQVADALDDTRGRAHYHIKELEKAGLVEIVEQVKKGGVMEKYYRAVAQNFYLGQGVGEHSELGAEVGEILSDNMFRWRRERVLDVDQESVIRRIVTDCLQCKPGNLVAILSDFDHGEFVEAFHEAIVQQGAHCIVLYSNSSLSELPPRWGEEIDTILSVDEFLDDFRINEVLMRRPDSDSELEDFHARLVAVGSRFRYPGVTFMPRDDPFINDLIRRGKRFTFLGCPSRRKSELMGLDFRALHDGLWTSLDIDYRQLAADCARLAAVLREGGELHLTSENGTDLRFHLPPTDPCIDDGILSDAEVAKGRAFGHLPAGKVIQAIQPESTEGVFIADLAGYFGEKIRGIRLEFEKGLLRDYSADSNAGLLTRVIESATGDVRMPGGIEIGMNPKVKGFIGYRIWDSNCSGAASLNIGDNRFIGGENRASLSWSFHLQTPTISLEDKVLVETGNYL